LKEASRLARLARHFAMEHKRLEFAKRASETTMRRVQARQRRLAADQTAAAEAEPPHRNAVAWLRWRGAYLGRTSTESKQLAASQEQLRIALALQKRRLVQSSGRQRAVEKLLAGAHSAEQRRAESVQQAEADQRAGISRLGRDDVI